MATVDVTARHTHRGHLKAYTDGSIRPTCDTCGYKGPKYNPADEPIAQVGLEAHIATAPGGDSVIYEITLDRSSWAWDWDVVAWARGVH